MKLLALAATSGFVRYRYTGKAVILLDDHHKTHEVDFLTNDEFSVKIKDNTAIIIHHDAPRIQFRALVTDKKYVRLMRSSTALEFQFIPTPKYPMYPFIPNLTFEAIPQIYEYLNDKYFNGMCPKKLLFKKTTSGTALGVAQYDVVNGRPLYRMLVNMKKIGTDMLVFIDVLLHEMVHLYLYRKGVEGNNNEILRDGHGKHFKAEMDRLNKFGFNISIILDWEKRTDAEVDTYVIRIQHPGDPTYSKYYWSLKNIQPFFKTIVAQVQAFDPTTLFTIDLIVTSEVAVRAMPQLSKDGKIPPAKLKLWWKDFKLKGRVVDTVTLTHQDVVDSNQWLKVPKSEEPYYAQPMNLFAAWFRKNKVPSATDGYVQTAWVRFPIEKIRPFTEIELVEINKALARGMNESDIKRRLTAVFASYDGRVNSYTYRSMIREIVAKKQLDALLQYPQLGL